MYIHVHYIQYIQYIQYSSRGTAVKCCAIQSNHNHDFSVATVLVTGYLVNTFVHRYMYMHVHMHAHVHYICMYMQLISISSSKQCLNSPDKNERVGSQNHHEMTCALQKIVEFYWGGSASLYVFRTILLPITRSFFSPNQI